MLFLLFRLFRSRVGSEGNSSEEEEEKEGGNLLPLITLLASRSVRFLCAAYSLISFWMANSGQLEASALWFSLQFTHLGASSKRGQ